MEKAGWWRNMSDREVSIDRDAVKDTVDRLITVRRFGGPREVLEELCQRLCTAGVGICGSAVFIRTLLPVSWAGGIPGLKAKG
jgi:hypothetical protein